MVTIIGAGLAGSITKRVLETNKIKCRIYDIEKPWRASPISENLFSLTWKNTLGENVFANGLRTLEQISNIQSIGFKTKAGFNHVLHVHPKNILTAYEKGSPLDAKGIVIDCRGYWADTGQAKMQGLTGQGLFIPGQLNKAPVMDMVAPYRHQKLFQWDSKTIWYGDSTCIDYDKYRLNQEGYESRCVERASKLIDTTGYKVVHGIRPYVAKQKGYLTLSKTRIVNTGGWKCGLIIYADQAQKIVTYIKNL